MNEFKSDRIAELVTETSSLLKKFSTALIDNQQLPSTQLLLLNALNANGKMTVSEAAAICHIAKPNITPVIDALESEGFVSRTHSTIDRRRMYIDLLPEGHAYIEKSRELLHTQAERFLVTLSESEKDDLVKALETVKNLIPEK